jgi:catechol 2,3-dioxygenase-like lactoylglutathione lyase family enzyme
VPIPVSDVDAAKRFYTEKMGFTLDHDVSTSPQFRVVQLTPPGSACSICFGRGIVKTAPGSVHVTTPSDREFLRFPLASVCVRSIRISRCYDLPRGSREVVSDCARQASTV